MNFTPDVRVIDQQVIAGNGWSVECVYTPGHTSNHICFEYREQQALFTGDHVMGWSTSIISPPDGDMGDYMLSLEKLLQRSDRIYWPTHGPSITEPQSFVRKFIQHRLEREQQIKDALARGVTQIEKMVPQMYEGLPEFMYPAAARSVLAAIEHMVNKGDVVSDASITLTARYALAN
jgi:glyoxylase-like metal-dependent hydrolase (beta-lactamase superfamily II)